MKISIIIPVYNVENYIQKCLESVFVQAYTDIEVILVDDASPDRSIPLAQELIRKNYRCDRFRIITHEINKGLSAARNSGVAVATGDYVYFLDSDDELYDEQSIAVLAENASKTNADVVIGNYLGVKSDSSYVSKYNKDRILIGNNLISSFVKGDVTITAWNKLIKRSLFADGRLSFKEGILNEDELFSYQLLFLNPVVSMIGATTYKYNIRPGSIMTTVNYNRLLSPVIVYEEIVKSYKAINGNNTMVLVNLDHFAFKRYVDIIRSSVETTVKRSLYHRLRTAQRSISGIGKMRYIYNSHLYMPKAIGFKVISIVANFYAKSRNLN